MESVQILLGKVWWQTIMELWAFLEATKLDRMEASLLQTVQTPLQEVPVLTTHLLADTVISDSPKATGQPPMAEMEHQ